MARGGDRYHADHAAAESTNLLRPVRCADHSRYRLHQFANRRSGHRDSDERGVFNADVSNADGTASTAVAATLSDGATQGVYAIDVKDIGAYATSMTASSWDPTETVSGTPDPFELVVTTSAGTNSYSYRKAHDSAS